MKQTARWIKTAAVAALTLSLCAFISSAYAADLPLAAASPLTGVSFDDRPLLLPVQRNFQMAMLTAGSELGRSCGRMEAYGWRMSQTEQARVNQIFNNTVDRLRLLGYTIAAQNLTSVSKDITLFTADRDSKHFIFLWSAGELGLVLNLCETSAPLPSAARAQPVSPSVQTFAVPMDVVPARLDAPSKLNAREAGGFTPVGKWVGGYTCAQGYTGGTLEIEHLHGQNFDGTFKFYPTEKNRTVPPGSYTIYGEYDKDSRRILINPGKWIKRPANFYNTVIVGGFDPINGSFSAYFQGIAGCTSFEARRFEQPASTHETGKTVKRRIVKKKTVARKPKLVVPTSDVTPASVSTPVSLAPASPALPVGSTMPVSIGSAPPLAIDSTAPSSAPASAPLAPGDDKNGILLAAPPPGNK